MMQASGLLLREGRGFFAQSGSYTQQVKNFVPICVFQVFQTDQLAQKTRWAPLPIHSEVPKA